MVEKDYSQYPGIIWDGDNGCLARAANNIQLANELVDMFLKSVPEEYAKFKAAYEFHSDKDYAALKDLAHRMRGALAYCVIPNLETALKELEYAAGKAATNPDDVNLQDQVEKFYAVVILQLEKYLPKKMSKVAV